MNNDLEKQPAESLNLTATIPKVIKYNRNLIKKVVIIWW